MKIINIITQDLRNEVSKTELELETCLVNTNLGVSEKIEQIKPKIRKWKEAIEDFKYWDSFVAERVSPGKEVENNDIIEEKNENE